MRAPIDHQEGAGRELRGVGGCLEAVETGDHLLGIGDLQHSAVPEVRDDERVMSRALRASRLVEVLGVTRGRAAFAELPDDGLIPDLDHAVVSGVGDERVAVGQTGGGVRSHDALLVAAHHARELPDLLHLPVDFEDAPAVAIADQERLREVGRQFLPRRRRRLGLNCRRSGGGRLGNSDSQLAGGRSHGCQRSGAGARQVMLPAHLELGVHLYHPVAPEDDGSRVDPEGRHGILDPLAALHGAGTVMPDNLLHVVEFEHALVARIGDEYPIIGEAVGVAGLCELARA
ncbi:hypothetical protein D3C86_510170 [compost metagenome]